MSDFHSKEDELFSKWLAGKLSEDESQQFEQQISDDSIWQNRMESASYLHMQSHAYEEQPVPEWDRSAGFVSNSNPWWQWQGIPAMSMVFSIFAITLVLLKVELVMTDDGMLISFANGSSQQNQIAKIVDDKIADFATQQQLTLAAYSTDIAKQQQKSNLELASYILSTSRQERKEDMSDFISFFNEQRREEQSLQRIRFQELENTIKYQSVMNKSSGFDVQPANWIVEE